MVVKTWSIFLILALTTKAFADGSSQHPLTNAIESVLQNSVRVYSIARVESGQTKRVPGSGFVIRRPKDQMPFIVTAAHNSQGDNSVFTVLPYGELREIACKAVKIDSNRDLLFLVPARALDELKTPGVPLGDESTLVAPGRTVWLIGGSDQLPLSCYVKTGFLAGAPKTAREFASQLRRISSDVRLSVRDDTMLILHTAPSSKGYSGGALVDEASGRVIGVQHAAFLNANQEHLAVGVKHVQALLDDIDVAEDVGKIRSGIARDSDLNKLVGLHSGSVIDENGWLIAPREPVPVRRNGSRFDGQCRHVTTGKAVTDRHLRRVRQVCEQMGESTLPPDEACASSQLFENPLFGFEFLVPTGKEPEVISTRAGIRITFDDQNPERDHNLTVYAVFLDEYQSEADRMFLAQSIRNGLDDTLEKRLRSYSNFHRSFVIRRMWNDIQTGILAQKSRAVSADEVDEKRKFVDETSGVEWLKASIQPTSKFRRQFVRIGLRNDVGIIVHRSASADSIEADKTDRFIEASIAFSEDKP